MDNSYLDFILHLTKPKKHKIVTIQKYFNIIPEKRKYKKANKTLIVADKYYIWEDLSYNEKNITVFIFDKPVIVKKGLCKFIVAPEVSISPKFNCKLIQNCIIDELVIHSKGYGPNIDSFYIVQSKIKTIKTKFYSLYLLGCLIDSIFPFAKDFSFSNESFFLKNYKIKVFSSNPLLKQDINSNEKLKNGIILIE